METKWLNLADGLQESAINTAIEILRAGEVVAFPTETVYGLGADARNEAAIEKVFAAKGRPSDNPLIVHLAEVDQLDDLVLEVPAYVKDLMRRFSPGPITYILQSKGNVAKNVTAGLGTVAVRIPNHPVALEILRRSKLPIAAPSANTSGKPSPTSAHHVFDDLDGKIAGIVDGGHTAVGLESTVVDCTGEVPLILRLGMITKEDIATVIGEVATHQTIVSEGEQPKSPGLKYKHYAPAVPLILVAGDVDKMQETIDAERFANHRVGVLTSSQVARKLTATQMIDVGDTPEEIAANLYKALRSFKSADVDVIVCESFPVDGIGAAIMDRLTRAAYKVIT